MGVYSLLTMRAVTAAGPLARRMELMLGSAVAEVPGYYELRLEVRCSGTA